MPTTPRQPGAAWQTYADELAILGHGIALWQPAPLHNYSRVNIGDVGYVRQGRFHLLFSAAQPLGNRQLGVDVPRDFVPINPGPTVKDQPRVPGALHTQYIEQKGAGISASSDLACIDIGTTLRFESSSRRGAILLTKYKTFSEDAERLGFFKEYMLRYQQSWVDHANQLGHMVNLDDVLMVTGHDMTLDFAMLAFSSNFRQIGMEFEAGVPAVASASASVWGTWRTSTSVHRNCGPQHREPPTSHPRSLSIGGSDDAGNLLSEYNQCVFIRGFRIRKRAGLIPTVIRAAAGVHDLGSGKRDDDEGPLLRRGPREDIEKDFEVVSDTPMFVDPLEPIFRYIFKHSKADTAIVHDSDLSNLLKIIGTSDLNDIAALIPKLSPHMIGITQDGIACMKALDLIGTPRFFNNINLTHPSPQLKDATEEHTGYQSHIRQHSSLRGVNVSQNAQFKYGQSENVSQTLRRYQDSERSFDAGQGYSSFSQTVLLHQSPTLQAHGTTGHTHPIVPGNLHIQENSSQPIRDDHLQTMTPSSHVDTMSHALSTANYETSEWSGESLAFPYERFPSPPSREQPRSDLVASTSSSALSRNGSPEIKLDFNFSSEPLFDGFPSTMFDSHRRSVQRISQGDNSLPPIQIPPPASPSSEAGSEDSDFSYVSAPDLDWGVSPGTSFFPRPRSAASTHRLARQDSATLPMDREAFLASLGPNSPDRHRRRHTHTSWRHSHRSRRNSSRPESLAGMFSPVEPMPEGAITRVSASVGQSGDVDRSRSRSRHRKNVRRSTPPPVSPAPTSTHLHAYAQQQRISGKGHEDENALLVDSDDEMLQFGDVLHDSLDDYMAEFIQPSPLARVVPLLAASRVNMQPPAQSPPSPEQGFQSIRTNKQANKYSGKANTYNDQANNSQWEQVQATLPPKLTHTNSVRTRRPLPPPPTSPPRTFPPTQQRHSAATYSSPGSAVRSLDASSQFLFHTSDLRASQFPETPQELSPLLSPPASAHVVSVPIQRKMPKAPIIDPAPPRRRRDRPPLPIGPRKPSVRVAAPARAAQKEAAAKSPEFQSPAVRWHGATMDVAKWTFTTGQLQDIVGRAIRQSAEASSIRLLPLDVLDQELPEEMQRLEGLREDIKARYCGTMLRRQVLLRQIGLLPDGLDQETRGRLIQELVNLSELCDMHSEDLYRIMDELQQINRLRDVHSASALAMALRKLNSSFIQRTTEIAELRVQRTQLEAERDEAWATAERIEQELIDLQAKMEVMSGTESRPNSAVANTRSSRVSAARKTSQRASKASLRFSRGTTRSSHSSLKSNNRLSILSPRISRLPRSQPLSLDTDIPFASVGAPHSMGLSSTFGHSPTSGARELLEVQNELYAILGLSRADIRRDHSRYRRASEVATPISVPASPFPQSSAGKGTSPISDALARRRRKASF